MDESVKYSDTGNSYVDTVDCPRSQPMNCFWESQLYSKTYFRNKKIKYGLPYYDNYNFTKYLFFHWLNKWIELSSKGYIEPYKLHPLPISDQILYWQPIFSKHVSDGLVKLETYKTSKTKTNKNDNIKRPYKSILLRAAILTFWKRIIFGLLGIIATNILSLSISILVKKLLKMLNNKTFGFFKIFFLLLSIILLQILDGLLIDNFTFVIYRIMVMVQCVISITIFQHGLCYRRKYFNNVEGSNILSVCNNVLHSCSPYSECSKNPLFCPALRYQNNDIAPNLFAIDFSDVFYISIILESLVCIVQFISNFIYGVLLMSFQVKVNLLVLYVIYMCFLLLIVSIEIINIFVYKTFLLYRDFRISKCLHIFPSLPIISKMLLDDLALNVIINARNSELFLFMISQFLAFFNRSLRTFFENLSFYLIKLYFLKMIEDASIITDVDTASFIATLYIFLRIVNSVFLIPVAIRIMALSTISLSRANRFVFYCSPNFYISDNKFTGDVVMSTDIGLVTTQINQDVVVQYRDATFAWINSRTDLLSGNYQPYLKNINFELKRGEIVIVTGPQGSGKSNFIKSILGEMTLVGGSMAVMPLHTSMPIFYASQDVWLQQGTIRSNIVFGYKFDEVLYNKVLKAVELEFDISTWENGDLRTVSDYAHSLSGGQRVRMEMARAIYAYLVFDQVNRKYNNNQCSFLMCLDSTFHGLDPFVSKTVFNNLFNAKSGLLVNDNLSVILTSDYKTLEKFVFSESQLYNQIKIFNINNSTLSFRCLLSEFIDKNHDVLHDFENSSTIFNQPYYINRLPSDMFKFCSSGSQTRLGRQILTKTKYAELYNSYNIDGYTTSNFNPYLLYMKAAGVNLIIFIVLTTILTFMDSIKFVLVTNLSDYITNKIDDYNNGKLIDMAEIRSKSSYYVKIILIFVIFIVIASFLSTIFMTFASIIASRRIHEYCINSIFNYSSEVLKIKGNIGQIMTFVTCDTVIIDRNIALYLTDSLVSFIHTIIRIVVLSYLVPLSIPIFAFTLILIYKFVFFKCVIASRNLEFGYFETSSQINTVIENAITGSSIYRSFKKESEFLTSVVEHDNYKSRCRFLVLSLRVWTSVLFNWSFSSATFVVLVFLIICDRYTRFKLNVGYFGLGLSLSMNVVKSFTTFSMTFAILGMFMCNIYRFRSFIPKGSKYKFIKKIDTHNETLIVKNHPEHDYKINVNEFKDRRFMEFVLDNNFVFIKKLFYKPKINLVDVSKYLPGEHSGIELKDLYVYTSTEHNPDTMILRNINASAHKSEIIGIIGRTGAGKTTLLSVLENTIENRTGQVLLDGKDIHDIPKNVTRQIIGVLPQLPFVFKGWTVRRFLDPRKLFSDDEINQALDNCGLLEFVNNLQGGKKLDSIIIPEEIKISKMKSGGEADTSKLYYKIYTLDVNDVPDSDNLLSYSQLRTLSFARLVLYRYFYRMIVIDEPPFESDESETSFVAQDIFNPIYELLKKYFSHCTTFVTAHDANVLKMCTSVWAMHEGQLIRKCKTSDIVQSGSISNIIEQMVKHS